MERREGLSDTEKGKVATFAETGWSQRMIAKRLERSRDVVQRILRDSDRYGGDYRFGREKLNTRGMSALFGEASSGTKSPAQLQQFLNAMLQDPTETGEVQPNVVGASTICRYLHDSGLFEYVKRKKAPRLTDAHVAARLAWAFAYVDYGERWQSTVFSDEKKFNLDGPNGSQYYWDDVRHERDQFLSRQMRGGSVMIWAAMSARDVSKIAFLDGKQDSAKYVDRLSEFFLPFAHFHYGTESVFQHDNAKIHTATITKEFLEEMAVDTMPWPACSPDLNPIENLWGPLVKRVYTNGKQYCSVKELKVSIEREWNMTLMSFCSSLSHR